MDRKRWSTDDSTGMLPAAAPLANSYVPYQSENPVQYEAKRAIIRGTLYPGLDLPFKGMVNKKYLPDTPMSEMQVLAFAIQELALYLDTHRNDLEALELYHKYQQMYTECSVRYVRKDGPLNHTDTEEGNEYQWLSDPWPWEYCANKEG